MKTKKMKNFQDEWVEKNYREIISQWNEHPIQFAFDMARTPNRSGLVHFVQPGNLKGLTGKTFGPQLIAIIDLDFGKEDFDGQE